MSELREAGWSPGKSFLFFLTVGRPESRLSGAGALQLVEHGRLSVSGALLTALENLGECLMTCTWSYS